MLTPTPILDSAHTDGYIPPSDADIVFWDDMASFEYDPLGFVMYNYPWGVAGTSLADKDGPDQWQIDVLTDIGDKLRAGGDRGAIVREAIASGHGVGKSAMICWLLEWAEATHEDTRGVVTANTEKQLTTKTWPELAKWHRMGISGEYFHLTATAYYSKDPLHEKTWRIDQVPWSEKNTEAFAGLHNEGNRIIVVFDEGAAIPDVIFETTEGALTDANTQIIWVVCGNPTRNTGRFRDCFEGLKHRWECRQVDSRTVKITNKKQLDEWIADYGEDSDFCRVRVRGVFPRAGAQQLISTDDIMASFVREALTSLYEPLILGVDVARFGDDESVIAIRKGRDGRTHPPIRLRGLDTMQLAAKVAETFNYFNADAVFVDGGGVGGGVVDRLRQLRVPVIEVNFGGKPDKISIDETHDKVYNKRAEMWVNLRNALHSGLALPDIPDLRKQLIQQTYDMRTIRGGDSILLTSKEMMKNDGLDSPDIADAYALTYAYPVQIDPNRMAGRAASKRVQVVSDYDPLNGLDEFLNTIH